MSGWASGLFFLLGASGAVAGEGADVAALENLLKIEVEGASRYAQPLTETPSSVTVVGAEDIRRFGFRDLGEALQMARGVHFSRDRAYTYLGVRGVSQPGDYNTRILLLQDGARINDPVYDQAMIGNESPIHMDWIKRLEFVPGPSSASYGGNALFGIANAVLWSGADIAGTRVSVDAGSGRLGQVGILSGGVLDNGLDWLVGLTTSRSRGGDVYFREYDQPGLADGVAHGLDGERHIKGLLKASLDGWRTSLTFSSREKDVPTAYYGTTFDAAGNFVRDGALHLDIGHSKAIAADWNQQFRLHLGHYRFDAGYPYTGYVNRDETRADWWSAEYSLLYSGLADHRILIGSQVTRGWRLQQRNFDVAPYASYLDDNRSYNRSGLYVQDEWRLSQRWLANWGVRLDRQTGEPNMTSPRLALIYRPADPLTVKFLIGRAFRYANAYERFYQDGSISQKPGDNLKPERIDTREVAADYLISPNLRLGLGHYHYNLRDLISRVNDPADGLDVFRNLDQAVRAQGWESELEALLAGGWRLRGGFTWMRTRDENGPLLNAPGRLGKLLIDGPLPWQNWTLGLNLQMVGARQGEQARAPSYVTGSLVVRQAAAARGSAWSLAVYNLGGKRYWDPAGREYAQTLLPSDKTEWRLRWEYGF